MTNTDEPLDRAPHDEPEGERRQQDERDAGAEAGPKPRVRPRTATHRRSTRTSLLKETAIILVSALLLSWAVKTFLVQPFFIPSESMMDTLVRGDRVLVSKLTPGPFDLHRGDVVVFKDPGGWLKDSGSRDELSPVQSALTFVGLLPQDSGEHLIKRIIGLPGDHVQCCDAQGRLMVNGTPIDETYIRPGTIPSQVEFDIVVAEDHLWVQGDNRQSSYDSRFTGGEEGGPQVPVENVVGVAFTKVWPFDRIALMRNPGDVFADVPAP